MNQIQTVQPIRAREYTANQLSLIRRTVAKDTTPDEFAMFIEVCKRVGLDPFRRQIYCLVYNKDKPDRRSVSFITGIDGFRACAARNGDYRPDPEPPRFEYSDEEKNDETNPLGIVSATVAPLKQDDKGEWFPVSATVYWEEFAPLQDEWEGPRGQRKKSGRKTLGGKWASMPRLMIAKCAEAQALRKGWPEDLSAMYAPEEMERSQIDDVNAAADEAEEQARLEKIHAKDAIPLVWEYGGPVVFTPVDQVFTAVERFIHENDAALVAWFKDTNQVGLNQYWGKCKTDAFELKRQFEAKKPELVTEGSG